MKICLTGPVNSGKSTTLKIIKKIDDSFSTFIVDQYIHEIYKFNNVGYKIIKKFFGNEFVNKKKVKRKELGNLVFSSKKELFKLTSNINPVIKNKILSLDENKKWIIELGTYYIYPSDFNDLFDKIIFLDDRKLKYEKNHRLNKLNFVKKYKRKGVVNTNNDFVHIDYFISNNAKIKDIDKKIKKILNKIKK